VERGMKRKLAIGATGIAVLSGAGVAYGVTQSKDSERQAYLNDAAKRLNVSPGKLESALKGAFADRLDAAVKAGRLTQAEADQIKKKVEQGGVPVPGAGPGPGPGGPPGFFFHHEGPGGPGGPGDPIKAGIDAAAKYLGLTDTQLLDKLKSGKSLADVAGTQKKDVAGLKTAIKDAVKTQLDEAVKNKGITQDQENRILDGLNQRLDGIVNQKGFGPGRAFGSRRGAHGAKRGFHFGSAPAPPPPGAPAGPII